MSLTGLSGLSGLAGAARPRPRTPPTGLSASWWPGPPAPGSAGVVLYWTRPDAGLAGLSLVTVTRGVDLEVHVASSEPSGPTLALGFEDSYAGGAPSLGDGHSYGVTYAYADGRSGTATAAVGPLPAVVARIYPSPGGLVLTCYANGSQGVNGDDDGGLGFAWSESVGQAAVTGASSDACTFDYSGIDPGVGAFADAIQLTATDTYGYGTANSTSVNVYVDPGAGTIVIL